MLRRYRYVQTLLDDWWNRWQGLVFPTLVPLYRWLQRHRNIQPGDVCLMKYSSKIPKGSYRLCLVKEVKRISSDSLVRLAIVVYKNPNSRVFKEVDRPVQSLVVIVPVKEQVETIEK